ncbi:MAG TPA: aminotransferase class V-fold PLP-dependent enzyme [Roseiflexaceae bacterium]|nr:aminotransferase class V-fold PLP-dependent enzyme [Roseiflexaceae bacterium]HMP40270.1 aminotransferase class V-fold PLP-dependent enzyme [Roseiflexaceae bacterium]
MTTPLTLPLPDLAAQFLLRRDVAFLNHGSYGACPRPVFETYQRWQRELESEPVQFIGRQLPARLAAARERLGALLGTSGMNVVLVPNVTYALNIVAHSLKLGPDDEVLTTNHEYGAVDRTWQYNLERSGARYVVQPIDLPLSSAAAIVEQIWAGVTERTKVIALSHITSPTALIMPIGEICRRARAAGILTVIDGAHAPGQIDVDVEALGADFYGGNCHKWLCAPKGAGFLYARPEHQQMLEPLVVSWGWRARAPRGSQFLDYFEYAGTNDPSAYLSVPAAIDFQEQNNWPAVRAACHTLAAETRRRAAEITGMPQPYPDTTDWWSQMCLIPLPRILEPQLPLLWEQYRIEIPTILWNDQLFVRLSVQAYTRPEDTDRLLEAIAALLDAA